MNWNFIEGGSEIHHKIIKEETKSMSISQIKKLVKDEIALLVNRIDESNLTRNLDENLIIFDE